MHVDSRRPVAGRNRRRQSERSQRFRHVTTFHPQLHSRLHIATGATLHHRPTARTQRVEGRRLDLGARQTQPIGRAQEVRGELAQLPMLEFERTYRYTHSGQFAWVNFARRTGTTSIVSDQPVEVQLQASCMQIERHQHPTADRRTSHIHSPTCFATRQLGAAIREVITHEQEMVCSDIRATQQLLNPQRMRTDHGTLRQAQSNPTGGIERRGVPFNPQARGILQLCFAAP